MELIIKGEPRETAPSEKDRERVKLSGLTNFTSLQNTPRNNNLTMLGESCKIVGGTIPIRNKEITFEAL